MNSDYKLLKEAYNSITERYTILIFGIESGQWTTVYSTTVDSIDAAHDKLNALGYIKDSGEDTWESEEARDYISDNIGIQYEEMYAKSQYRAIIVSSNALT